jgi:hypothetical protein
MMKAKRQITELQFAEEVVPPLATALGDDIVSTSFTSFSEGVHELTRSQPDNVPPIINADWCLCGNGTNSPRDLRSSSTSARLPLTSVQPGPMWNFSPQSFIRAGVSFSGSTLTETMTTSFPSREPRSFADLELPRKKMIRTAGGKIGINRNASTSAPDQRTQDVFPGKPQQMGRSRQL